METKQWTTIDKSGWGEGPWQDEPDKVQWTDEKTGLPCLAVRSGMGAWCGYVGVPEGHNWYQVKPFDIDLLDDVHSGLNFATFCQDDGDESHGVCHVPGPGEPDHVYWVGFDCGHAWDVAPGRDAMLREVAPELEGMHKEMEDRAFGARVYRDLAYVQREVRRLARQAAAA